MLDPIEGFKRAKAPSLAGFAEVMADIWIHTLWRWDDCNPPAGRNTTELSRKHSSDMGGWRSGMERQKNKIKNQTLLM